mgnify:CR=1 FL=1
MLKVRKEGKKERGVQVARDSSDDGGAPVGRRQVAANDPETPSVNLNNLDDAEPLQMIDLAEALMENTVVTEVWLCNCNMDTLGGQMFGQVLKRNATLTELNLETNRIGPKGMVALAKALKENTGLSILRLENQNTPMGNKAERLFVKALKANKSLVKLAADFHEQSSKNAVVSALTRNIDRARKARRKAA